MNKFYVRCRVCHTRHTFKKHPDDYIRLPLCRNCGKTNKGFLVVKPYKQITCYCLGYPYPHRYLSPNCLERVIAENTGVDWREYRSGKNPNHGVLRK